LQRKEVKAATDPYKESQQREIKATTDPDKESKLKESEAAIPQEEAQQQQNFLPKDFKATETPKRSRSPATREDVPTVPANRDEGEIPHVEAWEASTKKNQRYQCYCRCGCRQISNRSYRCSTCGNWITTKCGCITVIVPTPEEPALCHKCDEDQNYYWDQQHDSRRQRKDDWRNANGLSGSEPSARRRTGKKTSMIKKITKCSAFIAMTALQRNYLSGVEATESSLTQAETCRRVISTSSSVTTIGWIMMIILSFAIGRHHAKIQQRSAPPLHKLGAAATADSTASSSGTTTTTRSYEPPKETTTTPEGRTEERGREGSSPEEPEVTTRAVATQSQCTYTRHLAQPRFKVLPESGSGAYAG